MEVEMKALRKEAAWHSIVSNDGRCIAFVWKYWYV